MKRLHIKALGPIDEADVKFGDLTVLVGPQATGKSLFLQLYKAILDAPAIVAEFERYGFDWKDEADPVRAFCSLYFGGGLEGILGENTQIFRDGRRVDPKKIAIPPGPWSHQKVFLIPAQRVLALQDGWPKPFMAYGSGDSYAIRSFSESIREGMESSRAYYFGTYMSRAELRRPLDAAIYVDAKLDVEREGMRKRVVLKPSGNPLALPYSVWSAGQREFTPLVLGLSTNGFVKTPGAKTVIIEEPEMGLHPQAIVSFGLLMLDLMTDPLKVGLDSQVIISTHSPVILDLVWAIRELSSVAPDIAVPALCKIFNVDSSDAYTRDVLAEALQKSYRTYFFHRTDSGVVTEDISTLDPGDENENIAGWGGLSGFSGRIAQIVGEALAQ